MLRYGRFSSLLISASISATGAPPLSEQFYRGQAQAGRGRGMPGAGADARAAGRSGVLAPRSTASIAGGGSSRSSRDLVIHMLVLPSPVKTHLMCDEEALSSTTASVASCVSVYAASKHLGGFLALDTQKVTAFLDEDVPTVLARAWRDTLDPRSAETPSYFLDVSAAFDTVPLQSHSMPSILC
jgi:hypothetical protein